MAQEKKDLTGKRALVTGSSGGIGKHIALGLARAGADVVFNYKSHRAAAEEAAEIARGFGVRAFVLGADASHRDEVRRLVGDAATAMGGLEILINNVGEFAEKKLRDHTDEDFERIIAGTVGATFYATMAALPHLAEAGWGRVVNIGAAGAEVALGRRGIGPHLAGKAAVCSLTRSFALEESHHGITFNVVNPGVVEERDLSRQEAETRKDKKNPVRRPGTSADVVDAVLFFCRPESSFINGAILNVTGGWQGEA